MSKIEELISTYDTLNKTISDSIGQYIFDMMKDYPNVKSISFVHYTPYFNDGDACEWRLCVDGGKVVYQDDMGVEETLTIDELRSYAGYNRELHRSTYKQNDHPASKLVIDFGEFLEQIPSNIIENTFEEGEVIFDRDGTITEEDYDHE